MQDQTHPAPLMPNALSTTFAAEVQLQATVGRAELHEFQEGLTERLRRAQVAPVQQNGLALRIAGHHYLVALQQAGEIIGLPEISPVPLTKPWYLGLANIRGNLVSIIDLNLFMGGAPTPMDKDGRVLVFADDLRFNAAILVTHMQGLRAANQLKFADANIADIDITANVSPKPAWVGVAWRDQDDVVWEELNLATLIADTRFLEIGIW